MYTAVLEPQAVNDLVPLLAGALNARNADEGRSAFSKAGGGTRIGEKVDGRARDALFRSRRSAICWRSRSTPRACRSERTVWIENGVLKNLAYTRFWAQKQGKEPTGGGGGGGGACSAAGSTARRAERRRTEELIAGCERGVLVTHFFYIRSLDAAHGAADGPHARRRLPDRERKDHTAAEELPLERKPAAHAEQARGHRTPGADGRRAGMMPALRVRGLQLHVALRRGLASEFSSLTTAPDRQGLKACATKGARCQRNQ